LALLIDVVSPACVRSGDTRLLQEARKEATSRMEQAAMVVTLLPLPRVCALNDIVTVVVV
jgi:hypothetical protein